ncbi:UDP-N-acetylmuramate--L-alanine ligase [Saccharicrinis sp. FJH62]|uniref:UDP-N-acetylmuramate--L-alanine ligase n=1 Tax=Saccharicrinis sp. FJH62 TaxID=3344657 RepID=UPI0035D4C53B
MKIHFIAIGGSAMHNLALALHHKGYEVTGSDDEIFEPSKSRLKAAGILPEAWGWYPEKITKELDAIILGMHARKDNPELLEAQKKGIKVYSYPEYLYEQTKDKKRVVIGGSHGKTTITSMVMHVLRHQNINFDYMVGAQLEGFDTMVRLSHDAEIAVFEGDEYLSSPIDMRPKFHLYQPHIALLSGVAWDHINVFPTFDEYVMQFQTFVQLIEIRGELVYFEADEILKHIARQSRSDIRKTPYGTPKYKVINEVMNLETEYGPVPLNVFGEHNLQNIEGARNVCKALGVNDKDFYAAIESFMGASKRLQTLAKNDNLAVYLDFAHSPSKLKATVDAVKLKYPDKTVIACMELHTFSSLKKDFLPQYSGSMEKADEANVYFNPHVVEHKKLDPITKQDVANGFNGKNVTVYDHSDQLITNLKTKDLRNCVVLLMSSGNFDGVDLATFALELAEKYD